MLMMMIMMTTMTMIVNEMMIMMFHLSMGSSVKIDDCDSGYYDAALTFD